MFWLGPGPWLLSRAWIVALVSLGDAAPPYWWSTFHVVTLPELSVEPLMMKMSISLLLVKVWLDPKSIPASLLSTRSLVWSARPASMANRVASRAAVLTRIHAFSASPASMITLKRATSTGTSKAISIMLWPRSRFWILD